MEIELQNNIKISVTENEEIHGGKDIRRKINVILDMLPSSGRSWCELCHC